MSAIRLVNITKRYGSLTAVDDFTIDIKDGEYLTIVGPTGAGKTTILKIIAGLVEQDSGSVFIGNELINEYPPEKRSAVYFPQTYSLFPHFNVWENATFAPRIQGMREQEIDTIGKEMLNMVRLWKRPDALPIELSGGMQQRCGLARALAANARVLLLDEPLRALDARLRIELRYELRRLVKDLKITAIHVTHDQEEAMSISDRIAVIRSGKLEQVDTPQKLFDNPKNPFVANFIGFSNFIEGVVVDKTDDVLTINSTYGDHIMANGGFDIGNKIVASIKIEHTAVDKQNEGGPNTFFGEIEDFTFLGKFTMLDVKLDNGRKIVSKVPSTIALGYSKREKVRVKFPQEKLIIFEYPKLGLIKELGV
jgi:ABC-type Fe3+/spermidine/putrescine transport system ATPase subunit